MSETNQNTIEKPKLTLNQVTQMLYLNSVIGRFGDTRDLSGGIFSAGYHNGDTFRNTWTVFGYPQELIFNNYYQMYLRGGLAHACVMKPVKKRWSSYPEIFDEKSDDDNRNTDDRQPTEFEKAVQILIDDFDLWGVLKELDECQRIGLYGGVIITAKESSRVDDLKNTPLSVQGGINGLISLNPCYESQLSMRNSDRDTDMQSPRFGLPKSYEWREGPDIPGSTVGDSVSIQQEIHWTRAFAFSEYARGNGIVGRPALMSVFNSLMDWYKTLGSAAEGHWKNAKQRIQMNVTDAQLAARLFSSQENEDQDSYNKMMTEWDRGFNNTLDTAGIEAKVLQASIADPTHPANLAIQDICSGLGIPKTELIGFETGERSSTENANSWNVENQAWRTTTGTKLIIRFLKHLVQIGVLPQPKHGRIYVEWPDLSASSVEQRIENAAKLATAVKTLADGGHTMAAESIVKNLLPEVLDIEIESELNDEPNAGRDDAEDTDD